MQPVLILLLASGCSFFGGVEEFEGDAAGECSDDADNDQDGLFDCDDPDCAGADLCDDDGLLEQLPPTGTTPSGTTSWTGSTSTTVEDDGCNEGDFGQFIFVDNIDADGDGLCDGVALEAIGDLAGLPQGTSWDTIPWWSQALTGPENVRVDAMVRDFQEDDLSIPEATVDLWFDDDVGLPVDAAGVSTVSGLVTGLAARSCQAQAYRVTTDPKLNPTKTTYKFHHVYPPAVGGVVADGEFISVSETTYLLIPAIYGVAVQPDKAVIAGKAFDASRDPGTGWNVDTGTIEGVQVVVYDQNGDIPPDLSVHYFSDFFPDRDQLWTSPDGLWVALNVPPGELRVEMWGVVDGALRLLGASVLQSEADSFHLTDIYAGYGDGVKYPVACEVP